MKWRDTTSQSSLHLPSIHLEVWAYRGAWYASMDGGVSTKHDTREEAQASARKRLAVYVRALAREIDGDQ